MLLEFKFGNFRSFKDMATLNMMPATVKDLPYSILKDKSENKRNALCSSVIYGANASGKSNVLLAMDFLRELIISGSVSKQAYFPIEIMPCFYVKDNNPIEFEIRFIHKGLFIEYKLKIGGASFLAADESDVFIEYEQLTVNSQLQFERNKKSVVIFADNDFDEASQLMLKKQSENSLLADELFLSNGYKTLWNTDFYSVILDWFRNNLVIIQNISNVTSGPNISDEYGQMREAITGDFYMSDSIVDKIARESGVYASKIKFVRNKEKNIMEYASFVDAKHGVSSYAIESEGTMKLINFLPVVISVFLTGGTLVIDELDSSLHPSAVFSIVNAFHNNELNVNKAQLIFTSHNPIYQKAKIFRRDEIKFIEREGNSSRLYNLSDYGTSGENGVKNSTDIMKNYLSGKYGAINYIDYSDIIREAMQLNAEDSLQS